MIHPKDVYIVSPGRSVLTAKRGMAHAGGEITLADVSSAEVMQGFIDHKRVVLDEETHALRVKRDGKAAAVKEATAKAAAARVAKANEEAAAKEEAEAKANAPATEAEIIAAIGKLDKDNPEHWMKNGVTPQVAAIEHELGKNISAADRDAAVAAMGD